MSEIFISYKREEREKARAVAEAFAVRGYSVWWDVDLLPGDQFGDEIQAVIEHAKAAVVLWSKSAVGSNFVRDEARRAAGREILVPVRLDNCEPPLPFGTLHTLDLSSWDGSSDSPLLDPLMSAIENKVGRVPEASEFKETLEQILESPKGEAAFWISVTERVPQEIEEYEAYLDRYGGNGTFSKLAAIRIQKLRFTREKINVTTMGNVRWITVVIAAVSLLAIVALLLWDPTDEEQQETWFTVLASLKDNELEIAKNVANEKFSIVQRSSQTLPVEIWKTKTSKNYAVVVGGELDKKQAWRLVRKAQSENWASDAIAQIDEEWVIVGSAPFKIPEPPSVSLDTDIEVISSVTVRKRCPKLYENTKAVQNIPRIGQINGGDKVQFIESKSTLTGIPWWTIRFVDKNTNTIKTGCSVAESSGNPTMSKQ